MAEPKVYIIEVASLERLELQFIPPQLTWGRTAKDSEIVCVGANNPLQHYVSGSDELKFSVSFHALEEGKEDVKRRINWLMGLVHNNGYLSERPLVRIAWGKMLRNETWYLTSCPATYSGFDKAVNILPTQARVELAFKLAPRKNQTIRDVRNR